MKRGQAHAPVFEAVLSVPEGHKVSAQGNSKKIAKNLAAKMMLDKLDGKVKDKMMDTKEDREMTQDKKEMDQPDARDIIKEAKVEENANINVKVTLSLLQLHSSLG